MEIYEYCKSSIKTRGEGGEGLIRERPYYRGGLIHKSNDKALSDSFSILLSLILQIQRTILLVK